MDERRAARGRRWPALIAATFLVAFLAPLDGAAAATLTVAATVETASAPSVGDAMDDTAIWIHPTNPALSTVIATDKSTTGGLVVYDLSGNQLFFYADGRLNNVDVRYNFPLGGTTVALVGATNRDADRIDFYKVNETDRSLTKVGSVSTMPTIALPRGFALYHSPDSGKYYAFVTDRNSGFVAQYELNGTTGSVAGTLVRGFSNGGPSEGLAADDELKRVYSAQEDVGGIRRYGAEPGDGAVRVKVDSTTESGGNLTQDTKGLSIYYGTGGSGYLLAASQGNNTFQVYRRGDNAFVGSFKIVAGNGIDEVTGQDGIDVTNFPLGPGFPQGVFISQDTSNPGFNQNNKLVPWQSIANAFNPPLVIDTGFDPRTIGGGAPAPDTTPPETIIDSGPTGKTKTTTATFTFSADEAATFECKLDASAFSACTSPRTYSVGNGFHKLKVRATDTSNNIDLTPAKRKWTVDPTTPPPPADIRRESTATAVNLTPTNTLTVARPANTTAGDVLVACLASNGSTVPGVPAGWTSLMSNTSIPNPRVFGYYKVATASEPDSYSWALSKVVQSAGGIARYSGVSNGGVLAAFPTTAASATISSVATVPAVTTTAPNAMVVGCMSVNSSYATLTITGPVGMAEAWDLEGKRQELDDATQATAGSSGARSWTFNAARGWAGWLAALRPA